MIAYVFWHYPREDANLGTYEANLAALHDGLRTEGAKDFFTSFSYRVAGLPWIHGAGAAYEDWYVVSDWAAFAWLNATAVTGKQKAPHNGAAASLKAGAGGVYLLRAGAAPSNGGTSGQWFSKPEGMPYYALDEMLAPLLRTHALWQRQMVLGPGREFCLIGSEPATLPDGVKGLPVRRINIHLSTETS